MKQPFEVVADGLENYKFAVSLPVQFRDIDRRGHVNNAAYLSYLETVRLEYFINVLQIEQLDDYEEALPVLMVTQTINYRSPVLYREKLLIGVRINQVKKSSITFDFEMREEESKRLIADGSYVHVVYTPATHRSKPVPEEWLKRFEEFENRKLRLES